MDYYSGLFEVQDTTSTVAWRVITLLKSWFARHGIPITVMSDSGLQPFNSESFLQFSDEWDLKHITCSPHHPQSNGKVENAVKICKSLLKKARDNKQDPFLNVLEWRNTPTKGVGTSPAKLLYGRRTQTRLPVARKQLKPTLIEGMTKRKEKGKESKRDILIDNIGLWKGCQQATSSVCAAYVIQSSLLMKSLTSWVVNLIWPRLMEEDIVETENIYVRQ